MTWQYVEVSWIAGITFSKRGNGDKIWQKLHFLKWNCEFLKSIWRSRYTTLAKKDWKMIIEFYIILTWLSYEVEVRNEMSLFLGENQYFYKKIIHIFVIGQVKFLKFIVFSYLVLKLMLHYSTYIYPVVFTYKTCQNNFLFYLENWHFYIQVYFGKCMFCYFIDIRALSYYENDVHIVNISNGNSIYHVLWYHIKYWHPLKEGQVTLDRSPEFLFKSSNLYEPWHGISNNVECATSKASDQSAHTRSLIRAFASRLNILWVLSYWLNVIWSF